MRSFKGPPRWLYATMSLTSAVIAASLLFSSRSAPLIIQIVEQEASIGSAIVAVVFGVVFVLYRRIHSEH